MNSLETLRPRDLIDCPLGELLSLCQAVEVRTQQGARVLDQALRVRVVGAIAGSPDDVEALCSVMKVVAQRRRLRLPEGLDVHYSTRWRGWADLLDAQLAIADARTGGGR